jgi:hypothetical protein
MKSINELRLHPSVKAYVQHGFEPDGESGNQIYGFCPFCLRDKTPSFYVNTETKAWDCKACGQSGGFLTFLEAMYQHCETEFKGKAAIDLCKNRGLRVDTLRHFHIGYNVVTSAYTLPVFELDGKKIHDLRFYKDRKMNSTFSCKVGLFNAADSLRTEKVYICEGEWDGMALWEAMHDYNGNIDGVVAVPGAGTFKPEWVELLQDKHVVCLYDHDEAGRNGAAKVFNLLRPSTKSLRFLHWGEDKKEGYDIRDLYNDLKSGAIKQDDYVNVFEYIQKNMGDIPPGMTAEDILARASGSQESYAGEGTSCEEVYEGYKKYLHIPDTSVIDIIYGTVIANRMEGDPIWLFLVAPPGMTKTEFLQSISGAKNIKCISKMTPKTLVSGLNYGGHDPSLLPQLNGKTLVIKDFTAIFGMNVQARDEIFSTLRDAYDGNFIGAYGHGERNYTSRFGIIAGVTPAVEVYLDGESSLGERFLRFTMRIPKSLAEHLTFLERATSNVAKETGMREELKKIGTRCLDFKFADATAMIIPDAIHKKILHLAIFTAKLRATIVRDKFTKEVTHKPFMEMATRLSKQFQKLIMGICMFRRKLEATEEEYKLLTTLARGTIPSRVEDVIEALYKKNKASTRGGETFTQSEIAALVGLPSSTCSRLSEGLVMLHVLESNRVAQFKTEFKFTGEFLDIIEKCGVYL